MIASLGANWVTHNAGVATLALAMLTEFVWTAELAITAFAPMLALTHLAPVLTYDAALVTVAVPVDIELISSTATFTGPTDEELFSISIVRSHSECLGVTRVICIHLQQVPLI